MLGFRGAIDTTPSIPLNNPYLNPIYNPGLNLFRRLDSGSYEGWDDLTVEGPMLF